MSVALLLSAGGLSLWLLDRYVPRINALRLRATERLGHLWQHAAPVLSFAILVLVVSSGAWTLASGRSRTGTPGAFALSRFVAPSDERSALLDVLSSFNQASITASATNDLSLLEPYVAANSPAWDVLTWRYRERTRTGEHHQVELTRFATLPTTISVSGDTATVLAQEQWNDRRIAADGTERSHRTGVVLRQQYQLRRGRDGNWRVWTIITDVVDGGH